MDIYSTNNYRKIWEHFNGPIPKDEQGRSYEIHHVDGDHFNNHIDNFQCVPIKEHYDIHYRQEDWAACYLIAKRMKQPSDLLFELKSKAQCKRVKDKNHNFLGPNNTKKQLEEGKHPSQNKQSILKRSKKLKELAKNGKLSLQREDVRKTISESTTKRNKQKSLKKQLYAQNQPDVVCPHCGKIGKRIIMLRWHFERCKLRS